MRSPATRNARVTALNEAVGYAETLASNGRYSTKEEIVEFAEAFEAYLTADE